MDHFTERGNQVGTMDGVDLDMLAEYLKTKMDIRDISLRRAAQKMGLSPATLSRLLQGSNSKSVPDTINLTKAASWLHRTLSDFEYRKRPKDITLEEVEVHLRALQGVSEQTAATMIAAVRALYVMEEHESAGHAS